MRINPANGKIRPNSASSFPHALRKRLNFKASFWMSTPRAFSNAEGLFCVSSFNHAMKTASPPARTCSSFDRAVSGSSRFAPPNPSITSSARTAL